MTSGAAALCVAGVLVGVLIGSTGVGGVLLVPFLVHGLGYPEFEDRGLPDGRRAQEAASAVSTR